MERNIETRAAARSVDEYRGSGNHSAGGAYRVDRLVDGAARRHDVVDDEHPLAWGDREPASKLATRSSFAPLGVDRSRADLPCDLVGKDDPASCRSGNGLYPERPRPRGDRGAEP